MRNREQQKKPNWVGFVILLLLIAPEFVIPVGIFVGVVYVATQAAKAGQNTSGSSRSAKPNALDDCPKPLFCFHKDKGEHHVARGKEIDPWDRPDIDIRKYQRKE